MTKSLPFDQILIRKLTEIVLANLSDESFRAEKLAKEAGISRASLYRKLKFIKHEDISQFIREVRLNRAMEMLRNNEGTASEIAFRVGLEEARIYIDRALKLERYYWVLHNVNAWIYYFEDKYKEAIEACLIAQDLKPDYIYTNWLLLLNYAKLGDGMSAAEELQKIVRTATRTNKYDNEIMDAYKRSGVEGLFTWLADININRPVPAAGLSGHPFFIAWWNPLDSYSADRCNRIKLSAKSPIAGILFLLKTCSVRKIRNNLPLK